MSVMVVAATLFAIPPARLPGMSGSKIHAPYGAVCATKSNPVSLENVINWLSSSVINH
jgi:hypothetical protein